MLEFFVKPISESRKKKEQIRAIKKPVKSM